LLRANLFRVKRRDTEQRVAQRLGRFGRQPSAQFGFRLGVCTLALLRSLIEFIGPSLQRDGGLREKCDILQDLL